MAAEGSDYAALVKQAEKAVASVGDQELKRAAFEKVLEDLLSKRDDRASDARPVRKAPAATKAKATPSRTKKGPQGYLGELVEDDFFKKPKTLAEVKAELENRGHHIALTSLSGPLQTLCQRRTLRRQRAKSGNKHTFSYSNW